MTAPSATALTQHLKDRYAATMMPNYGVPELVLTKGEGCVVWDTDGNSYLDLVGGIAVSALGHAHPAIVAAVSEQVGKLAHISNLYAHEGQIALAERLLALLDAEGRVFFANSGTEANEAAVKLVRRVQGPSRPVFVAAEHGFHGRSMGSLSLTGKSSIRDPFAPFGVDVRFVPFGDADALTAAVGPDCAGVFLEPCLGEGGVVPAPAGYLAAARAACDAAGALLVLDEIQSGIGRTGSWFAFQAEGVVPDVITLAKGLGGGLPIGACIGIGAAGSGFARGDHGSTFGGNPVACAAALAVLDTIEREGLLENVKQVGAKLRDGLGSIDHKLVTGVRGSGLWQAIALSEPAASAIEAAARQSGFLVNAVQPDAIRLAPPLIISADQAETFKPVRSQDQLVDRLAERGVFVTQATLSRDLDEIGAVRLRGQDGVLIYALPPDHPEAPPPHPAVVGAEAYGLLSGLSGAAIAALGKVATDLLLSAEASGNLVVLKTPPGAAQLMASMIDRSGMAAILGTVAGDDTVLVVARDPAGGDELAGTFLKLAERRVKPVRGGQSSD